MPDLTYPEAMDAVRARVAPDWPADGGTLFVSPGGQEDALDYLVPWGAREYLVGGDRAFMLINGITTFVDRRNGDVRDEPTPLVLDKIEAMRPVDA